jgi:hypothetical protein
MIILSLRGPCKLSLVTLLRFSARSSPLANFCAYRRQPARLSTPITSAEMSLTPAGGKIHHCHKRIPRSTANIAEDQKKPCTEALY